jgi:ATP-binding cassette subfamily F protein 3
VLCGGERRRLALARIVVSGANLLVLDEPTNHLDIESREALEDALDSFPGTILFVSHDRALIEALATRTIAIENGRLRLRDGGFGEYARDHEPVVAKDPPRQAPPKPKQPRPAAAKAAAPKPPRSGRSGREARELESQIERLEEELGAVSARLSQPDAYQDHTAVAEDGHRHQQLQVELAHLYREWELRVG